MQHMSRQRTLPAMREKMTETVTIRLSETMKAELQALADADSRKLASYLTLVLQRHLQEKREKPKGRKP
jgi:predicted DNA-binding protein